jgi:hypothetical protein
MAVHCPPKHDLSAKDLVKQDVLSERTKNQEEPPRP